MEFLMIAAGFIFSFVILVFLPYEIINSYLKGANISYLLGYHKKELSIEHKKLLYAKVVKEKEIAKKRLLKLQNKHIETYRDIKVNEVHEKELLKIIKEYDEILNILGDDLL